MIVGFTGTRRGMTYAQAVQVADLLTDPAITRVLHGGCRGADAQFDSIALSLGLTRECWPGPSTDCTVLDRGGTIRIMQARPNLARNREIVQRCTGLIAAPASRERDVLEIRRGGTWFTMRRAHYERKPIVIVWPDGEVERLAQ